MATVKGFITLTLQAQKEGRVFVSQCLELDVASCGDTLDEALAAVREATTDYLNAIEQLGERPRIFSEKGIVIHRTKPRIASAATETPRSKAEKLIVRLPVAA